VSQAPPESTATRAIALSGLFFAGVVLAVAGMIGAAELFDAAGVHGDTQIVGTFVAVGVPGVALLAWRRWRALGVGLLVGVLLGVLATAWFNAMFHPGE
jgi:hypothetical protein